LKWLVIGGAGFLGSHLVERLVSRSEQVVVSDIVPPDGATRLYGLLPRVSYRWQSVHDLIPEDLRAIDRIAYCAAQADVPLALSSPRYTFQQNVMGILHLLEILRHSASEARTIYISTEDVYGAVPQNHMPIVEEEPLKPASPYGVSKATADMLCLSYAQTFSLPIIVLRSCGIFGPKSRSRQVIPIFIGQALRNEELTIEGDGSQTRDFNYVTNAVDAIDLASVRGMAGEAYNIASGEETSISDLANRIIKLTGSTSRIVSRPSRQGEKSLRMILSTSKARKELGYKPNIDFLEGLGATIRDYRKGTG